VEKDEALSQGDIHLPVKRNYIVVGSAGAAACKAPSEWTKGSLKYDNLHHDFGNM